MYLQEGSEVMADYTMITTKALAASLLGKRIVEVTFTRTKDNTGQPVAQPTLVLSNGSKLAFVVRELEGDYAVEMMQVTWEGKK
jgi:hypothetical protein